MSKPRSNKLVTPKVMLDEKTWGEIEQFAKEFKGGIYPTKNLMPYLMLMGLHAYRRGMRMEPEIRLGDEA